MNLFRPITTEELAARTTTQDFSFSVERLPYGKIVVNARQTGHKFKVSNIFAGHYAVGSYINENALNYLQLMHNDIYFEYCVAMSYKTWPFKTKLDLFILHVAESGIQKYWELKVFNVFQENIFLFFFFFCSNFD